MLAPTDCGNSAVRPSWTARTGKVISDQVLAGTLKLDVETILPLDRAADGLATLSSGQARGKIVVRVSD